jgi:hypothetical protein
MKTLARLLLMGILLGLAAAVGCNSDGDTSSGSISVGITDDPIKDLGITEVWVTIDSISVHRSGGGWLDIVPNARVSTPLTVNLLDLRNGITEDLGLDSLPADRYTQIRLRLGETPEGGLDNPHPFANYVVVGEGGDDPGTHELTIPSGHQSGIKLNHPFDIETGVTYELVLDFDAASSIHLTGSGKYMMRPTIGVIEVALTGQIEGAVTIPEDCSTSTEGVVVMAQQQADEGDPKTVQVIRSTVADQEGDFTLAFLPPGTYTVVAYKDDATAEKVALGYVTGVVVAAGEIVAQDVATDCPDRQQQDGTVTIDPLPDVPEEVVPLVTVFATDQSNDQDIILTIAGAPWDNVDAYRFSAGRPSDGFDFDYESDLGIATVD